MTMTPEQRAAAVRALVEARSAAAMARIAALIRDRSQ